MSKHILLKQTIHPKKAGRPRKWTEARRLIHQLKAENPWATVDWIEAQLWKPLKDNLPSRKTIERYIAEVMSPGPLDVRWSLAISHLYGIRPEANGYLLSLWKESLKHGRVFTVRQALWATRLKTAFSDNVTPELLLEWSILYSAREKLAGDKAIPNTDDLDAELAFYPREKRQLNIGLNDLRKWDYDQQVVTGAVPVTQWWPKLIDGLKILPSGGQGSMEQVMQWVPSAMEGVYRDEPRDFFLTQARNQLNSAWQGLGDKEGLRNKEEEPRDVRYCEWFPYAESVMVSWLRWIANSVAKWKDIGGYRFGREEHKESLKEWDTVCEKLARWVITEARLWSEKEGSGYYYLRAPFEILKEIGIPL